MHGFANRYIARLGPRQILDLAKTKHPVLKVATEQGKIGTIAYRCLRNPIEIPR